MTAKPLRPTIDPVPGLIRQIAVPAGTGMLFQTLFNVVDTWFAGLISTQALAALAVSFPVFFLVIALMIGVGVGGSALIANAIGGDDRRQACRFFGQALLLALLAGGLVALYGQFAIEALFRFAGVQGEALDLAKIYLLPILICSSFFILNGVCNGLLSAQGDTRSFRNALIAGALLNIVFNQLFMFGLGPLPGFGILGIAIATILIQALQFAYLWFRCRRSPVGALFSARDILPDARTMLALLHQAVPVTAQMLATGIGLFAITFFMGRHGEAAIAAYGIALRIEQVAMLPMMGLNTAALSLVGQNFGAGKLPRVATIAWTVLCYGTLCMIIAAFLVWPFRAELMALFTDDAEVIALGSAYLGVAVLIFNAYALLIISSAILQGMKRPIFAMVIGLFRHVLGPLVVLWLLDPVLGFGLPGIYWGIFAVAWVGALTSVLYVRYRMQVINDQSALVQLEGQRSPSSSAIVSNRSV
ncbi:MAG: MATE family efflux transporter [Geminicoccales bacterium]